jgi:hypothetical protein
MKKGLFICFGFFKLQTGFGKKTPFSLIPLRATMACRRLNGAVHASTESIPATGLSANGFYKIF